MTLGSRPVLVLALLALMGAPAGALPAAGPASRAADAAPSMDHPRLVILSLSERDPARAEEVLSNVGNIQKFYGADNVRIELVVYGPGVHHVLNDESTVKARIASLLAIGINIVACHATLDSMHKSPANLIQGVKVVPNGIPELIERQARGWIYVRP